MRMTSLYEIPCECGHLVRSTSPDGWCPKCGREFEVHWQQETGADGRSEGE